MKKKIIYIFLRYQVEKIAFSNSAFRRDGRFYKTTTFLLHRVEPTLSEKRGVDLKRGHMSFLQKVGGEALSSHLHLINMYDQTFGYVIFSALLSASLAPPFPISVLQHLSLFLYASSGASCQGCRDERSDWTAPKRGNLAILFTEKENVNIGMIKGVCICLLKFGGTVVPGVNIDYN